MARAVWRLMSARSAGKEEITIQTGAGLKTCVLTERSESEYEFEVEMGEAAVGTELAVRLGAHEVRGIPVSMGNPHYVVFVPKFAEDWQSASCGDSAQSSVQAGRER